jgi:thymidylate synthase
MENYLKLLADVVANGDPKKGRNGNTYSLFGESLKFDLQAGFPILSTKRVHWKSVVYELLWFIKGDTNIKYLNDNGVTIWDEWADENGDLGVVYGSQWRNWKTQDGTAIDQIAQVINDLKTNPDSRRHIVSAWNAGEISKMALPPCHALFQFYVNGDFELCCQLYQRSADMFLGVPFNIASYALLTHMVAQVCGLKVGFLIICFGDLHVYENHLEACAIQLGKKPSNALPKLLLNPETTCIDDFKYEDIELVGYNPQPVIKAPISK